LRHSDGGHAEGTCTAMARTAERVDACKLIVRRAPQQQSRYSWRSRDLRVT
jgi:hypothetical protein